MDVARIGIMVFVYDDRNKCYEIDGVSMRTARHIVTVGERTVPATIFIYVVW